jgi:hypothetical protein
MIAREMGTAHGLDQRSEERLAVEHFARVVVPGGGRWLGLLTNASPTGSYVRMLARPRLRDEVTIQPVNSVEVLKGVVVRVDEAGVGVKWFVPQVGALRCLNRCAS